MERIVPTTASEEIELYLRTLYSLLRSTADVQIRTLEEVHTATNSLLHINARHEFPDTSAFLYTLLRLPECMPWVRSVILGQSSEVFEQGGFKDVESWQEVSARARRRRCYFNNQDTLACFIASRSDIDDVIPTLTAYQIEWNKLNLLMQNVSPGLIEKAKPGTDEFDQLATALKISSDDLNRLVTVWGESFSASLKQIRECKMDLRVRLLDGSLSEYWRATRIWLDNIQQKCPEVAVRPIYFISSNPHSITNLLSGFAQVNEPELTHYLDQSENTDLKTEWQEIQNDRLQPSRSNFLYYLLKKYQSSPEGFHLIEAQRLYEEERGITRINSTHTFEVEAQVIDPNKLVPGDMDPRMSREDWNFLKLSNALILNIDYPLGLAAFNILAKAADQCGRILGAYIMGKAATLNGVRGDVMIPNVVQDEHSQNTYLFNNAFSAADVLPHLNFGSVLDNQKSMSVLGTFLQNAHIMDVIYREGYTDIEMEAGPYLSAVYEMYRPKRHPVNEIVNLYGIPFDLGILHYASDKPLSKGKNLGAGTLSYFGMDSTYACSIAILKRIFYQEDLRTRKSDLI